MVQVSGDGMEDWRINRLWFWVLVAAYFAIKIPLGQYVMANLGNPHNVASKFDLPLMIALAVVVEARLNDAGRSRLFGRYATFFIAVILPYALLFGLNFLGMLPKPLGATTSKQEFIDQFSMISIVPMVLLIALLIWAGTRPSKPTAPVSDAV